MKYDHWVKMEGNLENHHVLNDFNYLLIVAARFHSGLYAFWQFQLAIGGSQD